MLFRNKWQFGFLPASCLRACGWLCGNCGPRGAQRSLKPEPLHALPAELVPALLPALFCLQEKDVFEKYYKQHLAKRLLHGRSSSEDAGAGARAMFGSAAAS